MNLPKTSIITPSYNQGGFIERTIRSILNQNYQNLEYIIIDGKSTDNTSEILKKYKSENINTISEKDDGQVDAINKGLKIASGEIVAYINSDDLYAENAFELVSKAFIQNPDRKWFIGRCRIINEREEEILRWITFYKNFWLNLYSLNTLLILNYINQPAVFWTKEALSDIGEFNQNYNYAFDYDYWVRLAKKFPPLVLNQNLASFRIHGKSKGSTGYRNQFKEEEMIAKRHSQNKILQLLHHFNYLSIIGGYRIIR